MIVKVSREEMSLVIRAASVGRLVDGEFTEEEQALLKQIVELLDAKRQEVRDELARDDSVR